MRKIGIIFVILLIISGSAVASDEALNRAKKYIPQVVSLINSLWPKMPRKAVIAGQIEQESGWKEKATLKTSRELGRGFAQITIAYDKDHKERFNNFKNAVHMKGLEKWDWRNDPYNVKYQTSFLILTDKGNFNLERKFFIDDNETLKAMLVDYNAGNGRIILRRAYAKSHGIPSDRWDNGLALACSDSEKRTKIYGESLCDMVGDYPRVIFKRAGKYENLMK